MAEDDLRTVPLMPGPLRNDPLAITAIEPKSGVESVKRDVTLDSGWTFRATVLDPEGKPLIGARGYGVEDKFSRWTDKMDAAEFTVRCFSPRHPHDVIFHHQEKGLVGVMPLPEENGGSVTSDVQLAAMVTGRLLGADGKPRVGAGLKLQVQTKPYWDDYVLPNVRTDKDGRFRIETLVPGFRYTLSDDQGSVQFGDGLRSGVVKELGDVRLTKDQ